MQRLTISLSDELAAEFAALQQARGYVSRSEAVRDLVRDAIEAARRDTAPGHACVATLSYIYDDRTRALAQRLLDLRHARHDLVVATMQVVLDHASLLETVVLRGPSAAVRDLADRVRAERGVRFGALSIVGVAPNDDHRHPATDHHHHGHAHASPLA